MHTSNPIYLNIFINKGIGINNHFIVNNLVIVYPKILRFKLTTLQT